MSGSDGGGGYEYQARAAAYVAVHILTEQRLGWIEHQDADIPIAVAEETEGPGDDLLITLRSGIRIELQAKHGLQKNKLWEPLIKLAKGLQEDPELYGVILIDSTASKIIREDLRKDLLRLGQQRSDNLKDITRETRSKLNNAGLPNFGFECFKRLRIIVLDLDEGLQDGKQAHLLLSTCLRNQDQVAIVWKSLCSEGLKLITNRGNRDLRSWREFLSSIEVQLSSDSKATLLGKYLPHEIAKPRKLERDVEIKRLTDLLLSNAVIFLGISGMTGVGKSILALDLVKRDEIIKRFDNNLFWINIGRNPKLMDKQLQLARELGYRSNSFTTIEEGQTYLTNLLSGRKCLIILDDVWESVHISTFTTLLDSNSKLVFTTQNKSVIAQIGASEYPLSELNFSQSASLLKKWTNEEYDCNNISPDVDELLKKCRGLPLALSLCGAMIKDGISLQSIVKALQESSLDLIESDQFIHLYHEPNLLKALKVSVDNLESNIQSVYLELAIFPPYIEIPEEVVLMLWEQTSNVSPVKGKIILSKLENRSLLRRSNSRISLHDMQYAYLKAINQDQLSLQNKFIEAYKKRCPEGWHTGNDDGYFFDNLAYHLVKAGKEDELYSLLTQSPDWMNSKFKHCKGDAAYLSDISLALQNLSSSSEPKNILILFKLHTAYRVVNQRSLLYLSGYYPQALIWLERQEEVLSYARLYTDSSIKYATLANAYKTMLEAGKTDYNLLLEVYKTAKEIKDINHRISALGWVFIELYRLKDDRFNTVVNEAISVAEQVDDKQNKTRAFLSLANYLCEIDFREKALEIFQLARKAATEMDDHQQNLLIPQDRYKAEIEDEQWKTILLSEVSNYLWKNNFQEEAREALEQAKEFYSHSEKTIHFIEQYLKEKEYLGTININNLFLELEDPESNQEKIGQTIAEAFQLSSLKNFLEINIHSRNSAKSSLCHSLILFNRLDDAKDLLSEINEEFHEFMVLMSLVSKLAQCGELSESKRIALSYHLSSRNKVELLCQIIELITKNRNNGLEPVEFDKIIIETRNIINTEIFHFDEKQEALCRLCISLARSNASYLDQARSLVLEIEDVNHQSRALVEISQAQVKIREFNEARKSIEKIQDIQQRANALFYLSVSLAKYGKKPQALDILFLAQNLVFEINDLFELSSALRSVAVLVAKYGYSQQARAIFNRVNSFLSNIKDSASLNQAGLLLALSLVQANFLDEAEEVIKNFRSAISSDENSQFLYELAKAAVRSDDLDKTRQIVTKITNGELKVRAKCDIYKSLSTKGLHGEARQERLSILSDILESDSSDYSMYYLAMAEAELHYFSEAQSLISEVKSNNASLAAQCLAELAKLLAQVGKFEEARLIVWEIDTKSFYGLDYLQASVLIEIAMQAGIAHHPRTKEFFELAKEAIEHILSDWGKSKSLCELASALCKVNEIGEAKK
uniref:NB-ARC domain protein n=1 Tax=Cyanothece sp. (strain PCC 7425 / ATCC 29141) TaxID=395961 RepID=B8HW60_CYAP4